MSFEYTVYAYSPTLNQKMRQFNLEGGQNNQYHDPILAQQWADSFASQLNRQANQGVTDWQAQVAYEDLGIHTIPGYISSN